MKKKILISITVVLVLLITGGLGFTGNYLYNFALNPKNKVDLFSGKSAPVNKNETSGKSKENEEWLKDNAADKYIYSNDGLKLHSYEKDKENSNLYAIIVHGYKSEGSKMSSYAKRFYDMGYNVISPDLRGHGKSEGDYIGMGWHDRLDILKWIDRIIEKDKDAEIVLFGVSMGAATVMMTSGEELPLNVKAVIEDCGYSSVQDEFSMELKAVFNLPEFPILNAASIVTKIRAGYTFKEASAVEQLKKSKTPTLFIHGDKDTFVPYAMLDKVYDAAACEKEKLVIKGANHAESSRVNPDLYWSTIEKFLGKHVQG